MFKQLLIKVVYVWQWKAVAGDLVLVYFVFLYLSVIAYKNLMRLAGEPIFKQLLIKMLSISPPRRSRSIEPSKRL